MAAKPEGQSLGQILLDEVFRVQKETDSVIPGFFALRQANKKFFIYFQKWGPTLWHAQLL
jgi:hypothetical protein